MDKLYIFNTALDVFNKPPLTEEDISDETNPDVATLELHLGKAIRKAMREMNWSFLVTELDIGESLGPKGGFSDHYKLPDELYRLTRVCAPEYRHVGPYLLMDGKAEAYGIMKTVPEDGSVPDDFWDLVAYALAFFASSKLSPGDKKTNTALLSYNSILSNMVANECQNEASMTMED